MRLYDYDFLTLFIKPQFNLHAIINTVKDELDNKFRLDKLIYKCLYMNRIFILKVSRTSCKIFFISVTEKMIELQCNRVGICQHISIPC